MDIDKRIISNSVYREAFEFAKYISLRKIYGIERLVSGYKNPIVEAIVRKLTGNIYKFNIDIELEIKAIEDKIEIPEFYIKRFKNLFNYYHALSRFVHYSFIEFLEKKALTFKVDYIFSTRLILYIFGTYNNISINLGFDYDNTSKIFTSNIYSSTKKKFARFSDEFENDLIDYIYINVLNA